MDSHTPCEPSASSTPPASIQTSLSGGHVNKESARTASHPSESGV